MSLKSILGVGAVTFFAAIGLSACQQEMMPDSKIAWSTAGILGVSPDAIMISDRRSDATNTYYRARNQATGARYACVVNGGGLLALGNAAPPTCNHI